MTAPIAVRGRQERVVKGWQALGLWYRFIRDPIDFLEAGRAAHGPIFAVSNSVPMFPPSRQYVIAIGSEYNQAVVGQPDLFRNTSFTWRGSKRSAQRQIHYGLTRINGEKHRSHRQLLKPLFTKPALADCYDAIAATFDETLSSWSADQTIDFWAEMRTASVAISTDMLFGSEHRRRGVRLDQLLLQWVDTTQELQTFLLPLDVPGTKYGQLMRVAEQIKSTFGEIVDERRRSGNLGSDLFGVLLRELDRPGSTMTDTDLYSHATTMFAGSFENIANTVAWTMLLLAQHPRVMSELVHELDSALGGSIPSLEQLDELPFLEAVLKESMRILPSAPFLIRATEADTSLGGIPIRRHDVIFLSTYHTHRDPDLYPQPDRFDPWRWASIQPGPYEYLPFGAGTRVCIAKSFAWSQIKLMLAMVVQRWRLQMVANSRVDYRARIVLRPHTGMPMTVHRHDGQYQAMPIHGQICGLVDFSHGVETPDVRTIRLRLRRGAVMRDDQPLAKAA